MFRIIGILFCISLCFYSCQCQLQNYDHDIPCISRPHLADQAHDIRVALVLSGGGAKGMAHVGVLEVLEDAGIPIDLIVGCSAGSLVGSLYALTPSASWIKTELTEMKRKDFISMDFFTQCHGLSKGSGLKRFLLKHLGSIHFSELQIPLVVVATNLCNGELISFGRGPVAPSVHASCAFPFVFSPVQIGDSIFVDGGVIDPIPVTIAKKFNPLVIIAVDLSALLPRQLPTNLFGVAIRCHEIRTLSQSINCAQDADMIIRPELSEVGTFDDSCNEASYEAGKTAAIAALPKIEEILREKLTDGK